MPFDNPSNHKRAEKITDLLAHVETSAESNRATDDEITEMLAPVVKKLRAMGALPHAFTLEQGDLTQPSVSAPEPPLSAAEVPGGNWAADHNAPASAIIRDAAAAAPFKDLVVAMATFSTRLEEAIDEIAKATARESFPKQRP